MSPRSQTAVNARPSLAWSYVESASQYLLSVFDTAEEEAPRVLTLAASDLTPSESGYVSIAYPLPEALRIGKQYTFQVEAQVQEADQPQLLIHEVTFEVADGE